MKISKLTIGLYKILGFYPKTTKHIREITSENKHEGKALLSALKWINYALPRNSEKGLKSSLAVYRLERKLMQRKNRIVESDTMRQYSLSDFFSGDLGIPK